MSNIKTILNRGLWIADLIWDDEWLRIHHDYSAAPTLIPIESLSRLRAVLDEIELERAA